MKQFHVVIGNFGSGKSEISLNLVFDAAKTEKATLVDLDIVNPYFRSAERKTDLIKAGVRLIHSVFAFSTVDVPSLPPDVYSVFVDQSDTVVFDVGGDPTGATALGQYKPNFDELPPGALEVLYVVNPRRPLSATSALVLEMLESIQFCCRLPITGFINNGNLAVETSVDDLMEGYRILKDVVDATGIPVRYTTGEKRVLDAFLEQTKGEDQKYIGTPREINIYMHRDWDRFTTMGV